jgi:uncharacterized surface protein with fasciclin (FAS1) repeats
MSYEDSGISDSDDEYAEPHHVSVVDAALLSAAEMISARPAAIDEWGFADDDDIQPEPAPVRQAVSAPLTVPVEEHLFSMLAAAMLHDDDGFAKAAEHVGDLDDLPEEALGGAMLRAHALLTKGVHQANLKFEKPAFLKKLLRSRKTIVELLKEKKKTLNTLLAAVSTKGQQEPVIKPLSDKKKKFLVFAPIDSAFSALPGATLQDLLTEEKALVLTTLLHGHVVAGEIDLEKRAVNVQLQTLSGDVIRLADENGLLRIYYKNAVVGTVVNDVQTKQPAVYKTINGTVFVIDRVLVLDSVKIGADGLLVKSAPKKVQPLQAEPLDEDDEGSGTIYEELRGYGAMPEGAEGYGVFPRGVPQVPNNAIPEDGVYAPIPIFSPPDLPNSRDVPQSVQKARGQQNVPAQIAKSTVKPAPPQNPPPTPAPPPMDAKQKINAEFSDDEDDAPVAKSAWFSAPVARSPTVRLTTTPAAPAVAAAKPAAAPAPKKEISDALLARLLKK